MGGRLDLGECRVRDARTTRGLCQQSPFPPPLRPSFSSNRQNNNTRYSTARPWTQSTRTHTRIMPPRRSTRSAAPSEEPVSAPAPARRRTKVKQEPVEEPVDVVQEDDEEEEEEEQPTSKRRGSAKPSSSRRSASVSKKTASRAKVIKPEPVDEEDEEEEEEEQPKKTANGRSKRVTPAPKGKASKRAKRVADSDEEEESDGTVKAGGDRDAADEDFEDDAEPTSRAKPKSRAASTSAPPNSRSGASRGRISKATSSRQTLPNVTPKARKSLNGDESRIEEEEDPDDLPNFSNSPTRPRAPPTPKATKPAPEAEEESEEEDLLAAIRSVPPTPANGRRPSVPPPSFRAADAGQRADTSILNAGPEAKPDEEVPQGGRVALREGSVGTNTVHS